MRYPKSIKRVALVLLVAVAVSGCETETEPTYKGKPHSEWIRLAKDSHYETQRQAFEALSHMPTPEARSVLFARSEEYVGYAVDIAPLVYRSMGSTDTTRMNDILLKHLNAEMAGAEPYIFVESIARMIDKQDDPKIRAAFVSVAKAGKAKIGTDGWDDLLRAAEGRPTRSDERLKAVIEYRVIVPKDDAPSCPVCVKSTGFRIARRHANIDGKPSYRCDRCGLIEASSTGTTRPK